MDVKEEAEEFAYGDYARAAKDYLKEDDYPSPVGPPSHPSGPPSHPAGPHEPMGPLGPMVGSPIHVPSAPSSNR